MATPAPELEIAALRRRLADVEARLAEAQATLEAIGNGEVDAVVVDSGPAQVFTLQSADLPYRELVEHMADGALSLDRDHTILFCNDSFTDLAGVGRERLLGRSFMELVDVDTQHAVAAAIRDGAVARLRCELVRSDTERVPVGLTISPPGVHSPRRTTVMVSDRRVQERLATMTLDRDTAQAENIAKDRFIATLGHELRSPLAALANGIAVLRADDGASDRVKRVSQSMDRQARHLRALVDDLLDLSRVAQGKIVLEREEVAVADIVASVAEGLGERRARFEVTIEPVGLSLLADPTRLEQIVANLVANAVRYSEPTTLITLIVRVEREHVRIEVGDRGIGLEPADLERIFEPFVQVTSMSGGLGIGLSLVRQLVELHGGTIRAHSAGLGHGSTFEVLLPDIAVVRKPMVETAMTSNGGGLMVLVVDDNGDAADMLSMLLEVEGHRTVVCNSGHDALERIGEVAPDLVLLDLGLPDISGYEVARALRRRGGDKLLLFAVTGFAHDDARQKSKEAGFDEHLVKPIEVEQVMARVAAHGR